MTRKTTRLKIVPHGPTSGVKQAGSDSRGRVEAAQRPGQPRVSGRWLLGAVTLSIAAAAICVWGALCLLFWQGSWQLLYRPAAAVASTPASVGLRYESVDFAVNASGSPQLRGWWIPRPEAHYTAIYLHGANGNLGDTVGALNLLHRAGLNVFAFDYRGYGLSAFKRPSEVHWRQDADSALQYLVQTRHVDPGTIVLDGTGLGANMALEVAAEHPEVAGVVLDSPIDSPMDPVFNDARARSVPARLLVRDRYDLNAPAVALRVPLLWIMRSSPQEHGGSPEQPEAFAKVTAHKTLVWLNGSEDANTQYVDAFSRWLDDQQAR